MRGQLARDGDGIGGKLRRRVLMLNGGSGITTGGTVNDLEISGGEVAGNHYGAWCQRHGRHEPAVQERLRHFRRRSAVTAFCTEC
jgi:hypothetical protein